LRLMWLPEVLRAAGLQVALYDGWSARGNEKWGPLRGVVCHATASNIDSTTAGDCRVLWVTGSVTAPAPISQLYLGRDGVWTVGATGRCNHVLTGDKGPHRGYGNTALIGVEAANNNLGEPWSAHMLDSYQRGVAAICRHMGWAAGVVVGHREHQTGKSDPFGIDMNTFRARVSALLTGTEEDGMRYLRQPDGTIYQEPGTIDYATGLPELWRVKDLQAWQQYEAAGARFVQLKAPIDWHAYTLRTAGDPPPGGGLVLTDEQLADITDAAREGAEAGSPTHEELVAAANEAEDS
jgi:hypothetical protein